MNKRLKIALLGLLGLSTAACCTTKKSNKSQDKKDQEIDINQEDPRIMVMYGVPFPDGSIAQPVDEEGNPIDAAITESTNDGVPYPGAIAKPISEEEAKRVIEELKREEEAKKEAEEQESVEAVDIRPALMYGVPFPNGEVVRPVTEEQAEEGAEQSAETTEATE